MTITPEPETAGSAVSLPCSRCGARACSLTLPRIPEALQGWVGGIVALVNLKMPRGAKLSVPAHGDLGEAIQPEQLPTIAAALSIVCARCAS